MKKVHIIGLLLLIVTASYTAQAQIQSLDGVSISPPAFNSESSDNLNDYLLSNLEYPYGTFNQGLQGTEVVRFSVTTFGAISNITVLNSVSKEVDREVKRVLQRTGGNWNPGTVNGKPSEMTRELSLAFVLYSYQDMLKTANNHIQRGNKLVFEKNKPERALEYFNKAAKLFPNESSILYMQWYCLDQLDRGTEADAVRERYEFLASQHENKIHKNRNEVISFVDPVTVIYP